MHADCLPIAARQRSIGEHCRLFQKVLACAVRLERPSYTNKNYLPLPISVQLQLSHRFRLRSQLLHCKCGYSTCSESARLVKCAESHKEKTILRNAPPVYMRCYATYGKPLSLEISGAAIRKARILAMQTFPANNRGLSRCTSLSVDESSLCRVPLRQRGEV